MAGKIGACAPPAGLCGLLGVHISQSDVTIVLLLLLVQISVCYIARSSSMFIVLLSIETAGALLLLGRSVRISDDYARAKATSPLLPCPLAECVHRSTSQVRQRERTALEQAARSNTRHWTLVLVMGQLRTMVFTSESIVSNLLLPNEPCHVSVALDAPQRLPEQIRRALSPWLVSESSGAPPCQRSTSGTNVHACAHIEFRLALTALKSAVARPTAMRYKWMISVRTDTLIATPICVRCIYGHVAAPAFHTIYKRFRQYGTKRDERNRWQRSPTDMSGPAAAKMGGGGGGGGGSNASHRLSRAKRKMLQWLLSAGSPAIAHARDNVPPERRDLGHGSIRPPWCPAALPLCLQDHATAALRSDIAALEAGAVAAGSKHLVDNVRRLAQRHRLLLRVYVVGNTWLRFGDADVLAQHLQDSVTHYGRTFADLVADGNNATNLTALRPMHVWSVPHKRWENGSRVTEAQLRLSIFSINATLIDLPVPFYVPGSFVRLLNRDASDPPAYLLRQSHTVGVDACTCPHYVDHHS
jgi:hypothetical protein